MNDEDKLEGLQEIEQPSETVTVTAEPVITVTVSFDEEAKAIDIAERFEEHEKRIAGGK